MRAEPQSLRSYGATTVIIWLPAIALFLYFLGGTLPILGPQFLPAPMLASIHSIYSHTCHQIPDRSFHSGAAQMAFCARCTGFYGALAVLSLFVAATRVQRPISLTWLIAACVPMIIDVIFDLSLYLHWPNLGRIINGFVGGAGVALFVYPHYLALLRYSLARRQGTA